MAAVVVNDLGGNPWTLAEVGLATSANVKVRTFMLLEAEPDGVAEILDVNDRLVVRLTEAQPSMEYGGWVHGLNVDRLDSGYVLVSLLTS